MEPWIGKAKRLVVVTLMLSVFGCATIDTVATAPLTEGVSNQFPGSYDAVSGATIASLSSLNVDVKSTEQRPEGLVILVSKRLSGFSWGEVGRIFVQRSDKDWTDVFVRWEKRAQFQLTGTGENEFSATLFQSISAALNNK